MKTDGTVPFGLYAEVYDLLYQDKDYPAEAAFVAALIQKFRTNAAATPRVIDLACGTGKHVFELARMGFDVTGSDVSEQMISVARQSAAQRGLSIPFYAESFRTCHRIQGSYDVALAMFASLGYVQGREELMDALSAIRHLLTPGGLFIFDVWNGLSVLRDYSPVRVRRVAGRTSNVIRISRTSLDELQQLATVGFEFVVLRDGAEPIEFSEQHVVRFFFPRELVDILSANGFELLLQCPFLDASRVLESRDWNATLVVRKT